MKQYKIHEKNAKQKRISIIHKKVKYIDIVFPNEQEKQAIKSADMTILKHRLPFETKIIKPIKKL